MRASEWDPTNSSFFVSSIVVKKKSIKKFYFIRFLLLNFLSLRFKVQILLKNFHFSPTKNFLFSFRIFRRELEKFPRRDFPENFRAANICRRWKFSQELFFTSKNFPSLTHTHSCLWKFYPGIKRTSKKVFFKSFPRRFRDTNFLKFLKLLFLKPQSWRWLRKIHNFSTTSSENFPL